MAAFGHLTYFVLSSLSIFLNLKLAYLKPFISDNKSISLFLIAEAVSSRIQDLNIIRTCIIFKSMRSFRYFCILLIKKIFNYFVLLYKGLSELLPAPLTWETFSACCQYHLLGKPFQPVLYSLGLFI